MFLAALLKLRDPGANNLPPGSLNILLTFVHIYHSEIVTEYELFLSDYDHCITIATETVFLLHSHFVSLHNEIVASESGHHHKHGAERHVEIRDKRGAYAKVVGREYEFVGPT